MKRVVVFLLLVIALDAVVGNGLGVLYRRTYTGERGGLLNYALTKPADVLVLGSSRAQFQVMPALLQQTLDMTTFNAGLKGHDFLYAVMLYDLWKRSHPAPRAILLQMDIESLLDRPRELEAAQIFAPYLDQSALVRDVLYSAGPLKRAEYWSRSYRYNGKLFSIVRNLFVHPDFTADGYVPARGTLNPATDTTVANALDQDATALDYAQRPFSPSKVRYLRDLAEDAARKQTRLVLFHTPLYNQDSEAHRIWTERLTALLKDMPGVEFIDICEATHPETFAAKPALYNDVNHLNVKGATLFSTMLANELKNRVFANAAVPSSGATARQAEPAVTVMQPAPQLLAGEHTLARAQ